MASNEEYLDNLLRSVSLDLDNPTSDDDRISVDTEEKWTAEAESLQSDPDIEGELSLTDMEPEVSEDISGLSDSNIGMSDIGFDITEDASPISERDPDLSDMGPGLEVIDPEEPAEELQMAEAAESGSTSDMIDMSDMDALLDAVSGRESPDLQDVMQMSASDIDSLLDSNRDSDLTDDVQDELPDLSDLLKSVEDDEDLEEITSLLQKSDDNQAVDEGVLDLLKGNSGDKEDGSMRNGNSVADDEKVPQESMSKREKRAADKKARQEAKKAAKEAKRKKKAPQEDEKVQETEGSEAEDLIPGLMPLGDEEVAVLPEEPGAENQISSETKKGFFSKILDFFTEEDEPEDDEANSLNLSEENATILAEMKKEGGKKKKKSKKKKGKETPEGEEGQEENQSKGKKGKGKEKKEKKAKKEVVPALEEVSQTPEKKLSLKRIILIALAAASIMAIILIASIVSGDYADRKNARVAYYSGDYQNCYQDLFGKKLDETESVMFNKSAAVLRMRLYMREYELLVSLGQHVEALDSLIQTVDEYPLLYDNAAQWNAAEDVGQIYQQMLAILENTYGLSEEEAKSVASEPDDVEYTRMVIAIAEGNDLAQWKDDQDKASMKDVLPEEEELTDTSFMENSP